MPCGLAGKLGEQELGQIDALEHGLGVPVLAVSCHATDSAPISEEDLAKIKRLEVTGSVCHWSPSLSEGRRRRPSRLSASGGAARH
jgi:hypothetical protein